MIGSMWYKIYKAYRIKTQNDMLIQTRYDNISSGQYKMIQTWYNKYTNTIYNDMFVFVLFVWALLSHLRISFIHLEIYYYTWTCTYTCTIQNENHKRYDLGYHINYPKRPKASLQIVKIYLLKCECICYKSEVISQCFLRLEPLEIVN